MMNIFFRKGTSNSESNSTKGDSEVLNCKESKNENDDDILILTSTDNDKQTKTPTLLTQTVQQLFGRTSSSTVQSNVNNNNKTDEKMIVDPSNTDDQLIDLN